MGDLFHTALMYPAVGYTVFLGFVCLYWVFVILGALDIDALDFDIDADAVVEGATEGAAEGAAEAMNGAGALGLMNVLSLRNAPVTVVFSFIALFGWVFSIVGIHYLGLTGWARGTVLGIGALALALPLTSVVTRPLRPIFRTPSGRRRAELAGESCTVTTGRVDGRFGQAEAHLGNDVLLIQIRCDGAASLTKGQEALIIHYDEEREAYMVEPMEESSK